MHGERIQNDWDKKHKMTWLQDGVAVANMQQVFLNHVWHIYTNLVPYAMALSLLGPSVISLLAGVGEVALEG